LALYKGRTECVTKKKHNKRIAETLKDSENRDSDRLNKYDGTKYIHRKTDLLDGCV